MRWSGGWRSCRLGHNDCRTELSRSQHIRPHTQRPGQLGKDQQAWLLQTAFHLLKALNLVPAFAAEKEPAMIGERTRFALAAKKALGATLGNRTNLAEAQTMGAAANRQAADAFAGNVLPVMRELQIRGITTVWAIAEALNAGGIRTAEGGAWHARRCGIYWNAGR